MITSGASNLRVLIGGQNKPVLLSKVTIYTVEIFLISWDIKRSKRKHFNKCWWHSLYSRHLLVSFDHDQLWVLIISRCYFIFIFIKEYVFFKKSSLIRCLDSFNSVLFDHSFRYIYLIHVPINGTYHGSIVSGFWQISFPLCSSIQFSRQALYHSFCPEQNIALRQSRKARKVILKDTRTIRSKNAVGCL